MPTRGTLRPPPTADGGPPPDRPWRPGRTASAGGHAPPARALPEPQNVGTGKWNGQLARRRGGGQPPR